MGPTELKLLQKQAEPLTTAKTAAEEFQRPVNNFQIKVCNPFAEK